MHPRRRLAVLMANITGKDYQHRMLDGIIGQAHALDYDIAIFSPFISFDNSTEYLHGENQIYSLCNYDMFDAVLYLPCSFYDDVVRNMIERDLAARCHCPIISVEAEDLRYSCIQVDDRKAFRQVVDHLIEEHGLTDILCLTGYRNNYQAEERAKGYRDSMEAHGLPVPEDHIVYGDFWRAGALALAQELLTGARPMPQAVACASDNIAITLCNELTEHGVNVPEDIAISSYDAGPASTDNEPSISSYLRPISDMGMRGVLRAHELITGEVCEPFRSDFGCLIPAESCGCGAAYFERMEQRIREQHEFTTYRDIFEETPMAERLNSAVTLNDLLYQITSHFYLIGGLKEYYLCMNDEWDDLSKNTDDSSAYSDYTDTMHLCISYSEYSDTESTFPDIKFSRDQLLPALYEPCEYPRALFITPLHFNERCFGYAALGFGKKVMAFDSVYHAWTRNINNALEFLRIRNNLISMNQRLFMTSLRDSLTGIFNRNGFAHFSEEVFTRARENAAQKKLLVIAADLDLLKDINDTYGHAEGDNAISVVANALNTCFEFGEICARTGGDEFLVIGCADYSEELIWEYIDYIQRFFERYNTEAGKPYEVSASLGYVCEAVTEGRDLQFYVDEADARMYANKTKRRKHRS